MKRWEFLRPGDIVDIVAPASHTAQISLDQGAAWLESLKLIPRMQPGIIQGDVFFAAPLKIQLEQFKDALYSDSKAIWCVRGGYGSLRLIPYLQKLKPPRRTKIFLGFSDITALHLFFNQQWKWPTIHSRNISAMKTEESRLRDRKVLQDLILGKLTSPLCFKRLTPLNQAAQENKTISGQITGGNMRILQTSLKTSWELKAKGKILFIEDVAERGYSVDRMFEQLIQARIIDKGLTALVIGQFTEGEEKNGTDLTSQALTRFASSVPYPVLRGLPCGHGEINFPLPLGTHCELILGRQAQLLCDSGGK